MRLRSWRSDRWELLTLGNQDEVSNVVNALIKWFLPVLVLLSSAWPALAGEQAIWTVVESNDNRLVLEVKIPSLIWQTESSGEGKFASHGFNAEMIRSGRAFPALNLPVAIPPGGDVSIRAEVIQPYRLGRAYGELYDYEPELPPSEDGWPFSGQRSSAELDQVFADGQGFVQMSRPGWGSELRQVHLAVYGVRPDAAGNLLSCDEIRITINFPPSTAGNSDAVFTPLHKRVVVNPDQVSRWMRVSSPTLTKRRTTDSFGDATSPWLRIEIDQRGFYKLDTADLTELGIDPASVDLSELRLFGGDGLIIPEDVTLDSLEPWMKQYALLIRDDDEGAWGPNTSVYFVANGADGWLADKEQAVTGDDRFNQHQYSNTMVYWLSWGGDFSQAPARMNEQVANPRGDEISDVAVQRQHLERNDGYYDNHVRQRDVAYELFYYRKLSSSRNPSPINVRTTLTGLYPDSTARIRAAFWGLSWRNDQYNDHKVEISVDGSESASTEWEFINRAILEMEKSDPLLNTTVQLVVPGRLDNAGRLLIDSILLDWVEIDYPVSLIATNDSLDFFAPADLSYGDGFHVSGLSTSENIFVLDGTYATNPMLLTPIFEQTGEEWVAKFSVFPRPTVDSHVTVISLDDAAKPADIEVRRWNGERLRERTAAADYIIVCADQFVDQAEELGAHRRTHFWGAAGDSAQSAEVVVVPVSDIYDEFGWGLKDPTAIRNFLVHAYNNWRGDATAPVLSHLLLFGDALYDARGYDNTSRKDLVPGHLFYNWNFQYSTSSNPAFAGDEWYSLLDGPDDAIPDLIVGRLPIGNRSEADDVVEKVINFDLNPPAGDWKTKFIYAADDLCKGTSTDNITHHMNQVETLSNDFSPENVDLDKIYLLEYGYECLYNVKPEATADLMDLLNAGTLMLNFTGHGSELQLADERLLETSKLASLSNQDKPFMLVTASCAVGKFIHDGDGLAVNLIRMPGAGAIAAVSASGEASAYYNGVMNNNILAAMYPSGSILEPVTIGAGVMAGKTSTNLSQQWNNRRYNLFADPASRFPVPEYRIELALEDIPEVDAVSDTLQRGAPATLRGRILDQHGNLESSFNGTVDVKIRDSDVKVIYLVSALERHYYLKGNPLYSGEADVTDGEFTVPFFVPTTLRIGPRGPARITAFASGDGAMDNKEAYGSLMDLMVPEMVQPTTDTTPPEIEIGWENPGETLTFGSRFEASLFDSSGIYVAALSPSRSVIVRVEDEDGRILIADDVASAIVSAGDYRSSSLVWELPAALPANTSLSLTLEASDNVGLRGFSETLTFSIADGSSGSDKLLLGAFAMPNPVDRETYFLCDIHRTADLEIAIFTNSGRKIATLSQAGMSRSEAGEAGIYWDGRDDDGDLLANGVYFYQVAATATDGVTEELIERLVVFR
jgi:Peptidase family C25